MPSMRSWLCAVSLACAACGGGETSGDGGGGGLGGGAAATATATAQLATSTAAGLSTCSELASPPTFAIGTGETCYEPLEDGDTVPRLSGPQGGFHIWASIACANCPPEVILTIGAKVEGETAWMSGPSTLVADIEAQQIAGLFLYLPGPPEVPSIPPEGTAVRVFADATDLAGGSLHAAERLVILGELQLWVPHCETDPMICGQPGGPPCCPR